MNKRMTKYQFIILCILCLFSLTMIYPMYNVLLVSLNPYGAGIDGFHILPRNLDFSTYKTLFSNKVVPRGFAVTTTITVLGTLYSMFLSVTMGYALSKKGYPGRKAIMIFVIITMFFSGGLIPSYLVVRSLGLIDSILSMVIPAGINTFYMILLINYFSNIPESLEESAKIDGANELVILARIILPIAVPILATVALFYAVDRWNEYFSSILYIRSPEKRPIQAILRDMLVTMDMSMNTQMDVSSKKNIYSESLRMGIVIVTSLPILMVYPFLQKYFTKGIMIGSLKE